MPKGLSAGKLKIIGIVTMVLDHLQVFFPGVFPLWFRYIGRLTIPIFAFLLAESFYHTSNRRRFGLRLYLFSAVTGVAITAVCFCFESNAQLIYRVNIIATYFLAFLAMAIYEWVKQKKWRQAAITATLLILLTLAGNFLFPLIPKYLWPALGGISPAVNLVEGGVMILLLPLLFYLTRDDKLGGALCFTVYSVFIATAGLASGKGLLEAFQWMQVFALPLLLLYNGRPGHTPKWIFYIFYPLHLALFYLLHCIV